MVALILKREAPAREWRRLSVFLDRGHIGAYKARAAGFAGARERLLPPCANFIMRQRPH